PLEQRRQPPLVLIQEIDCRRGQGRREVSGIPRADDGRVDARMMKHPRNRERGHLDPACVRRFGKAVQPAKYTVALEMSIRLGTQRHPRAFGIDLGRSIPSREPSAGERTERRESEALVGTERKELALGSASEQAERVLHPVEAAQAGLVAYAQRPREPRRL